MAAQEFTATFNGSTDTVAVLFTGVRAAVPSVIPGLPVLNNPADAFVEAWVAGQPTSSGCTVKASAPFNGTVTVLVIG